MNEAFKPADKIRKLKIYSSYYINMKKKADKSIIVNMNRFEKAANFAKQYKKAKKGLAKYMAGHGQTTDQWDVVRVAACRIVSTGHVDGQISVKDKEIDKVPTNCVKETEEVPGIDIEPNQQEQESVPEEVERQEPKKPEPAEVPEEEAEGQDI